jgi:hypothetical protein
MPSCLPEHATRALCASAGQRFDTVRVPPLTEGLAYDSLIAGEAFDSNPIIADLDARGAKAANSQHPHRAPPLSIERNGTNGDI